MDATALMLNIALAVALIIAVVTAMVVIPNRHGAPHPSELRARSDGVSPARQLRKAA